MGIFKKSVLSGLVLKQFAGLFPVFFTQKRKIRAFQGLKPLFLKKERSKNSKPRSKNQCKDDLDAFDEKRRRKFCVLIEN